MPIGSSITYKASGTISSSATGTLSDTATVTAPSDVADPNLANNSVTDIDTITVRAHVKETVTDKKRKTLSGAKDTYTIVVNNVGPSRVTAGVASHNYLPIFSACI